MSYMKWAHIIKWTITWQWTKYCRRLMKKYTLNADKMKAYNRQTFRREKDISCQLLVHPPQACSDSTRAKSKNGELSPWFPHRWQKFKHFSHTHHCYLPALGSWNQLWASWYGAFVSWLASNTWMLNTFLLYWERQISHLPVHYQVAPSGLGEARPKPRNGNSIQISNTEWSPRLLGLSLLPPRFHTVKVHPPKSKFGYLTILIWFTTANVLRKKKVL